MLSCCLILFLLVFWCHLQLREKNVRVGVNPSLVHWEFKIYLADKVPSDTYWYRINILPSDRE